MAGDPIPLAGLSFPASSGGGTTAIPLKSLSFPSPTPGAAGLMIPQPVSAPPPAAAPSVPEALWQDMTAMGAGAGQAFGDQVLGAQQLVGHALSGLGFTNSGQWLIDDAARGVKKLRGEEKPYAKTAPISATLGGVAGGSVLPVVLTGGAGEASPLAQAIGLGALGGALQPAQAKGDFVQQKAEQIGMGAAAGGITHGVLTGAAGAIAPQVSPDVKSLLDRGVRLTPGQILGGPARWLESAIGSVPGIGLMIRSARMEGLEDYNRAVLGDVLEPLGEKLPDAVEAGRGGIGYVQGRLRAAYKHLLDGKMFKVDPQFATDIAGLRTLVTKLMPSETSDLRSLVADRVIPRLLKTGTMDGTTFQELDSELTRYAQRYHASAIAGEQNLGDVISAMQEKLRDGMERSNPGFAPEYGRTRLAYRMLSRVEEASTRRNASNGIFLPSDLLAAINSNARRTGQAKAFAAGDALLQSAAQTGQNVLPSTVPNSGTPERLMAAGLLGGGWMTDKITPHELLGVGLAAAPYTPPGLAFTRALATPGAARTAIGQTLRSLSPYVAGGAGAQAQRALTDLGVH